MQKHHGREIDFAREVLREPAPRLSHQIPVACLRFRAILVAACRGFPVNRNPCNHANTMSTDLALATPEYDHARVSSDHREGQGQPVSWLLTQ